MGRTMMRISVVPMALAIGLAAAPVAALAVVDRTTSSAVSTRAPFSDLNYAPTAGSQTAGRGAFSNLNYSPDGTERPVGRGVFSDLNAFGKLRVPPVAAVAGPRTATSLSAHGWSTAWRTISLTTIAGLLAIGLALVSTLYTRGRRPAI